MGPTCPFSDQRGQNDWAETSATGRIGADLSVRTRRVACHLTVTLVVKMGDKSRTKSEYGREVASRLSSQLSDSPRKTPAPANRDLITHKAINRRVASSNLARGANLIFHPSLNCAAFFNFDLCCLASQVDQMRLLRQAKKPSK